jgi:type I restriction enzyme, S subunit
MEAAVEISAAVKNVPALRFPEFEGEWEERKLDKLVEFKSGGTPSMKHPEYWDGQIPWISASSMVGKYYSKSDRTITELGLANGSRLTPKGSLLLLVRGSMLFNKIPVGIADRDVSFNQDVKALITKDESDTEFIYQWFSAKQNQLLNIVTGTGIGAGKLDTEELKNMKVHLPYIVEQQKIASCFSATDDKIQQLSKKKALLEKYKKGVMQQLFSQQIRFKDDKGNDFPEWEEKKLGEVFERVKRKNTEDNQNVLTISGQHGLISQTEFFNKSVASDSLKGYYLLHKGDYAYNKSYSANYSMGAFKRLTRYEKGVLSPLYICLRIADGSSEEYFDHYFESGSLNKELHKIAQEGARNHGILNMSIVEFFNDIKLFKPTISEQLKIAEFIDSIDNKINYTSKQLEQAKQFKKGLLQQLFV